MWRVDVRGADSGSVLLRCSSFLQRQSVSTSPCLQTSFTPRNDACGLSSILRKGDELNEDDVLAWEAVNAPFVLEFNT